MEPSAYSIPDLLGTLVEQTPPIARAAVSSADYGFNASRFKKPDQSMEAVVAGIVEGLRPRLPEGIAVDSEKGYVNFRVSNAVLAEVAGRIVANPKGGIRPEKGRIMVEFFSPNTNKPAHLGHLRNIALGESLARVLQFLGYEVIKANIFNDRGSHICKSMLAYKMHGKGQTPESAGIKGDHFVGDFYVRYEQDLQAQLKPIVERLKASPEGAGLPEEKLVELAKKEAPLVLEVSTMLQQWEDGDPEVRALWEKMNGWAIGGMEETLKRLDTRFDAVYFESKIYKRAVEIIDMGLQKGVFEKDPTGAVVADLKKLGLGEGKKVLLRSDGTSVYMTQDLAMAKLRTEENKLDAIMYVVASEQAYHFKVLFGILKALGYEWAGKLRHVSYGMVDLPHGRMKSREGTVVDADDLLDDLCERAKQKNDEGGTEAKKAEAIDDALADAIGIAAMRYYLLSNRPDSKIKFDPEASVKLEGKTGPYVLYQLVRSGKIIQKYEEEIEAGDKQSPDFSALAEPAEHELLLALVDFTETIREVKRTLDQTLLSDYVYRLAKAFSQFYGACPIFKAQDESAAPVTPEQKRARFELVRYVHTLLGVSLTLLGIKTVDRM